MPKPAPAHEWTRSVVCPSPYGMNGRLRRLLRGCVGAWLPCVCRDSACGVGLGAQPISKFRRKLGLGKSVRLPELSLEPKSKVLSLINEDKLARVYFVSVCHPCAGREGALQPGSADASDDATCTTLIVAVQPGQVVDTCRVEVQNVKEVSLDSDIVTLEPALSAALFGSQDVSSATHAAFVFCVFPLPEGQRYLCSQAACGSLTHRWHLSTLHAIDFEAEIGTEVLAVADGRVIDIKDSVSTGGIHVRSFFEFNAITIEHYDGVELSSQDDTARLAPRRPPLRRVRSRARGSASRRVSVGGNGQTWTAYRRGWPSRLLSKPHLHIEAHREHHPKAPSIPIAFIFSALQDNAEDSAAVVPVAGRWYEPGVGQVCPPPSLDDEVVLPSHRSAPPISSIHASRATDVAAFSFDQCGPAKELGGRDASITQVIEASFDY